MDCPVCPITVGKALRKVPGVARAEVDFATREAIVTFDDARAGLDDLTRATKDAGYPSKPVAKAR
jgi:mercuric ion binding protein